MFFRVFRVFRGYNFLNSIAFEFSVQVIRVEVRKFMSKQIQYSNESIGEIKLIADFLPSPAELALKIQNYNFSQFRKYCLF